jgi:hypothetical protein
VYPKAGWPLSAAEFAFAESLFSDLRPLGYNLALEDEGLIFTQRIPTSSDAFRKFYRVAHAKVHSALLIPEIERIVDFEARFGLEVFIEGKTLDLGKIDPQLRPVDLRAPDVSVRDRAIVDYLRSYQTVGSRMSVGKENVYILEDRGQPRTPVMGVLVLASPRYYQPRRDEVLGWLPPSRLRVLSERKQKHQTKIRHEGLDRIMHVAICCALPPYSELGTARLLAMAPFTAIVRDDFAARWDRKDPDLAIVTTTTGMGITGVPFQALRRGKFVDKENADLLGDNWNKEGKLYSRLGSAHPWSCKPLASAETFANFTQLVTPQTIERARVLVQKSGIGTLSDLQILDRAMNHFGWNRRFFRGNPLGIFIGACDRQSIEAVSSGKRRMKRPVLDWDLAVRQFRSDFDEAPDPTRKPGMNIDERTAAKMKRRNKAVQVAFDKILLSRILLRQEADEPTSDVEASE